MGISSASALMLVSESMMMVPIPARFRQQVIPVILTAMSVTLMCRSNHSWRKDISLKSLPGSGVIPAKVSSRISRRVSKIIYCLIFYIYCLLTQYNEINICQCFDPVLYPYFFYSSRDS